MDTAVEVVDNSVVELVDDCDVDVVDDSVVEIVDNLDVEILDDASKSTFKFSLLSNTVAQHYAVHLLWNLKDRLTKCTQNMGL